MDLLSPKISCCDNITSLSESSDKSKLSSCQEALLVVSYLINVDPPTDLKAVSRAVKQEVEQLAKTADVMYILQS